MVSELSINIAYGMIGVTLGVGLKNVLLASVRNMARSTIFALLIGYVAILALAILMWYIS